MSTGPARIQWDEEHDEPYLALPSFPDIRLTPWRPTDVQDMMDLYNDPAVGSFAHRRPYPFKEEDTDFFLKIAAPLYTETINLLRKVYHPQADSSSSNTSTAPLSPEAPSFVPVWPLGALRLTSGKVIGDLFFFVRGAFGAEGESPADMMMRTSREMTKKPIDEISLETAYNILTEYTKRGIVSEALRVAIEGWVDWIGIPQLTAHAQTDNIASYRILEKAGFVKDIVEKEEWPADKGGGYKEIALFIRKSNLPSEASI